MCYPNLRTLLAKTKHSPMCDLLRTIIKNKNKNVKKNNRADISVTAYFERERFFHLSLKKKKQLPSQK